MRKVSFIVTFHVVRPEEIELFKETAQFLAENFHVVPLDQLVETVERQMPTEKQGYVAITFDDGLRNHAEVAYPILKELGIPATFYLCPELVDRGGSIWTWEIHSRLERLGEIDRRPFFEMTGVSGELQRIIDRMKKIPVDEREQIEKRIRELTPDFRFTESERRFIRIDELEPDRDSRSASHYDWFSYRDTHRPAAGHARPTRAGTFAQQRNSRDAPEEKSSTFRLSKRKF